MRNWLKRLRSPAAAFAHDLLIIPPAWLLAYWIRFDLGPIPGPFLETAVMTLPGIMLVQACANWAFGLYRGVWRFASVPDFKRIAKAVAVGVVCTVLLLFLVTRMEAVPRTVIPLYALLQIVFLGGSRLVYRSLKDRRLGARPSGERALIVGCGAAAEQLARDLLRSRQSACRLVGFVDDNPAKLGREIHGIRVLGRLDDLPRLAAELQVDLILIAIPSLGSARMRRLVELCEQCRLPFRTLPKLEQLVSGEVSISSLREVSIEDLLGREPVVLSLERMHQRIHNAVVLVTGGGGSIGSELCLRLAEQQPARLVIVDNSEYNLYRVMQMLAARFPALVQRGHLVDVMDAAAINQVLAAERPKLVYHAAAYKHVPLLEDQPIAAIRNNVLGTRNAMRAAHAAGCEVFVLISTDKAVKPVSVMGATKRLAELLGKSFNRISKTAFITVRFGNVLDSAGSVVPLFRRQIRAGGPVTVTHPEVERYFMTLTEAAQLIIEASALGGGGETYCLDMGEPIAIQYLAEQMIRLSGQEPGSDIEIRHTGLRPGEKMREELLFADEIRIATANPKVFLTRGGAGEPAGFERLLADLEQAAEGLDAAAVVAALQRLVPLCSAAERTSPVAEIISLEQRRG
ncbi:MAG: polysaccharide biosynthesis protein [Gammaproteobacteria bacterium]|nr:polysaccharide biosynthesis protein [Gammaproteobacteria bacterium]